MIDLKIYLRKYDWLIDVYYMVSPDNVDEIVTSLLHIGSPDSNTNSIKLSVTAGTHNVGFVYSNCDERESIIIINESTNSEEFLNSMVCEALEVAKHIAKKEGYEEDSDCTNMILGNVLHTMYERGKYIVRYYEII